MASHAAENLQNERRDSVTATKRVMVLCPKTVRRTSKDRPQQPRLSVAKSVERACRRHSRMLPISCNGRGNFQLKKLVVMRRSSVVDNAIGPSIQAVYGCKRSAKQGAARAQRKHHAQCGFIAAANQACGVNAWRVESCSLFTAKSPN
eukprot:6201373-Pleurochrysis_carterae.AAC.1